MVVSCAEALRGDFQEREYGNFLQSVREDRTQPKGCDCTAVPSLFTGYEVKITRPVQLVGTTIYFTGKLEPDAASTSAISLGIGGPRILHSSAVTTIFSSIRTPPKSRQLSTSS